MAAYVMIETSVADDAWMAEYRERVPKLIQKHGGRYLARGVPVAVLEGDRELPSVCAILEFPTAEQAKAWYNDFDYGPMIRLRQTGARTAMVLFQSD